MKNIAYYNGKTSPIEEMMVPMNDRVCYFGDGVYEAVFTRRHHPFALDDHIDRFFRSCDLMRSPHPMEKVELAALLLDMVSKVDAPEQVLYWQATRGTAMRAHAFPEEGRPNLWITAREGKLKDPKIPWNLLTVEDTRFFHCNIKTLNLIPNVMASQAAKEADCQEAVFHRGEIVTEGAHSNISILKNGVFITHPLDCGILPGITRAHLIRLCHTLNIPVKERTFTVQEMMDADEVIVSGSGTPCIRVAQIDHTPVGQKAKTLFYSLQAAYLEEFDQGTR